MPVDTRPPPTGRHPNTAEATTTTGSAATGSVTELAAHLLHERGDPDAGKKLRDEHDHRGRCRGCPHAGTVAPLFPCLLRRIGEAAAQLNRRSARDKEIPDDHDRR